MKTWKAIVLLKILWSSGRKSRKKFKLLIMKIIIATVAIFIFAIFVIKSSKGDKEEMKGVARQMMQECKIAEKASDEDVECILNEKIPKSHEGKCVIACSQENSGIIDKGSFNKTVFMQYANMICKV